MIKGEVKTIETKLKMIKGIRNYNGRSTKKLKRMMPIVIVTAEIICWRETFCRLSDLFLSKRVPMSTERILEDLMRAWKG